MRWSHPEGFIGKDEATQVLGCTRRTVDNWMRLKRIPYYKFGRRVYFKRDDLLSAVARSLVESK